MPAYSTDECYALAFDRVVAPLARAFRPDIIVAQLGVDAHHSDPQTELGLTMPGYRSLVRGIIGLADELCDGRLAALGGGGYHIVDVVPLAWTWVLAELGGVDLCEEVPAAWHAHVCSLLGYESPRSMGADDAFDSPPERAERVLELTADRIREVREVVFPHHGLDALEDPESDRWPALSDRTARRLRQRPLAAPRCVGTRMCTRARDG